MAGAPRERERTVSGVVLVHEGLTEIEEALESACTQIGVNADKLVRVISRLASLHGQDIYFPDPIQVEIGYGSNVLVTGVQGDPRKGPLGGLITDEDTVIPLSSIDERAAAGGLVRVATAAFEQVKEAYSVESHD